MISFKKGIFVLTACFASIATVNAAQISQQNTKQWNFSGSLGFYHINTMLNDDGDTFLNRLSIEKLFRQRDQSSVGLELGVQSGNQSRLGMSDLSITHNFC